MNGMILGEEIANSFFLASPWPLLGWLFRLALLVYVIFALLVVRQINLLNSILGTELSTAFKIFSYLHLILAIGALVFSFLVI
jgi:hypothetical protein